MLCPINASRPYPGRDQWQWGAGLLSANNITIRDSWVDGGDDNVCIKNDTSNVLVENIVFLNGHGATIGSVPDGNGLHGFITNVYVTFVAQCSMSSPFWTELGALAQYLDASEPGCAWARVDGRPSRA